MLKLLQLESFKAFGQRATIPLAPITLIFGQNSSGKSTILQSLNLLKQTRESRDADALLLPRAESGLTDLGSFHEMLFDHDEERQLRIRIDKLEFAFARISTKHEITLDKLHLYHDGEEHPLATYEKTPVPHDIRVDNVRLFLRKKRSDSGYMRGAKCVYTNAESSYWNSEFERIAKSKSDIIHELCQILQSEEHNESELEYPDAGSRDKTRTEWPESPECQKIRDFISYLSSREFTRDSFRQRAAEDQLGQFILFDDFLPIGEGFPSDHVSLDQSFATLDRIFDYSSDFDLSVNLGKATIAAGRQLDQTLTKLFSLGPFRKLPSRWYVFSGTTPLDVGFQGQSLPDLLFRKEQIRDETNEWLKRLGIGYEIIARSLGTPGSDLFELRLRDLLRNRTVEVGLTDVGFGISQILPLVVQSLAARDQVISVEQPEVHIHPRLQADLGDLLIEGTKEPRRNQFLIETHSEHLALRLQRRVRERQISPNDISILYVSRGEGGSTVTQLKLDENGDFMDEFPGGFFPERLRELM
jgi:energy-coupling factor transporter ATP-binding protein EcfA2